MVLQTCWEEEKITMSREIFGGAATSLGLPS